MLQERYSRNMPSFPHRHLLGVQSLSSEDIFTILDLAEKYVALNRQKDKKQSLLKGQTLINVFFENSTRTRTSFELAGKRLGADVINISMSSSSVSKGETLLDTASTLDAMHPDFITIRHQHSGAVQLIASKVHCAVINAGDGAHEHPTQALLDALTIRRRRKGQDFKGMKIAICGDILHSRVARSNIWLLSTLGADIHVIAPPTLLPPGIRDWGVTVHHRMQDGIKDADVVMMLRLQRERMKGHFVPSEQEYFHFYGLDYGKLALAHKDVFVMHPGPINRGIEIDSELADDIQRSVILDQVEMGVAVRQAILELLAQNAEEK